MHLYTLSEWLKLKTPNTSEDAEKLDYSYTAGGDAKEYRPLGKR